MYFQASYSGVSVPGQGFPSLDSEAGLSLRHREKTLQSINPREKQLDQVKKQELSPGFTPSPPHSTPSHLIHIYLEGPSPSPGAGAE